MDRRTQHDGLRRVITFFRILSSVRPLRRRGSLQAGKFLNNWATNSSSARTYSERTFYIGRLCYLLFFLLFIDVLFYSAKSMSSRERECCGMDRRSNTASGCARQRMLIMWASGLWHFATNLLVLALMLVITEATFSRLCTDCLFSDIDRFEGSFLIAAVVVQNTDNIANRVLCDVMYRLYAKASLTLKKGIRFCGVVQV